MASKSSARHRPACAIADTISVKGIRLAGAPLYLDMQVRPAIPFSVAPLFVGSLMLQSSLLYLNHS